MEDTTVRENRSTSVQDLIKALIAARAKFKPALKTAINPHFKSHYVDLAGVMDAVDEGLNANGLALIATVRHTADALFLDSVLYHESGQWVSSSMPLVAKDPQTIGSSMSYARRYCAMALLGIAPEDDDGEAASVRRPPTNGNGGTHAPRHEAPAWEPKTELERDWRANFPNAAYPGDDFAKAKLMALGGSFKPGAKAPQSVLATQLHTVLTKLGLATREAKMEWVCASLGKHVESSKELSDEEMNRLINKADAEQVGQ